MERRYGANLARKAGAIPYTLRLGESLDPFNPAVQSFGLSRRKRVFLQQTGDPAAAQRSQRWQALENLRHQQASALAYFDCFLAIRRHDARGDVTSYCL